VTNPTMANAMCATYLLACVCAGVELRGGGRQRGEGQLETCRADRPRVVKDGREAWTERPRGRVTSRGG
jgi:hypothetical protein